MRPAPVVAAGHTIDGEPNGEIFYRLSGNDIIDAKLGGQELLVPQRDVLHLRLKARSLDDLEMLQNIKNQQNQFLANRAMPSAVFTTDLSLNENQVRNLRDRWNEASKGPHQGGMPILTHGLKVMPWAAPGVAKDMLIVE